MMHTATTGKSPAQINRERIRNMILLSLFSAVIVVMAAIPFLGYIPLGFMNATTLHIPVIIGACILGPKAGAILGGVFGLTSMIKATVQPNITSFVFTPFYSFNDSFSGGWPSVLISMVPRILVGLLAGLAFRFLMRILREKKGREIIALAVAGLVGSLTNTLLVMNLIFVFFGNEFASAAEKAANTYTAIVLTAVGVQGIPEALVAAVLNTAVCKVLLRFVKGKGGLAL